MPRGKGKTHRRRGITAVAEGAQKLGKCGFIVFGSELGAVSVARSSEEAWRGFYRRAGRSAHSKRSGRRSACMWPHLLRHGHASGISVRSGGVTQAQGTVVTLGRVVWLRPRCRWDAAAEVT